MSDLFNCEIADHCTSKKCQYRWTRNIAHIGDSTLYRIFKQRQREHGFGWIQTHCRDRGAVDGEVLSVAMDSHPRTRRVLWMTEWKDE